MASFEQHINGSVVATGVFIIPLHDAGLLDISQSIIVLALGIVGGILPDLDADNSKPIQIVFKILSIFLPLLALLTFSPDVPLSYLGIIWILLGFILHLTLFKFLLSLTHHRGVFHTIPMGVFFAQIVFFIFERTLGFSLEFSTLSGLFLFYGFIIHLLLDELVSLNVFGIRVKHSFGTALKLYDKHNLKGTTLLYIVIISFFLLVPIDNELFVKVLDVMSNVEFFMIETTNP